MMIKVIVIIMMIKVITCALVWRSEVGSCGKVQELHPRQRYNRRPRRRPGHLCDQCILCVIDVDDDDDDDEDVGVDNEDVGVVGVDDDDDEN